MDRAVQDREVIVVRRRNAGDVAIIAADKLQSLMEAAHLLRAEKNAKHLVSALTRARSHELEPLKYLGPDVWSRRITQEHRCVYLIKAGRVEFLQGRYHY